MTNINELLSEVYKETVERRSSASSLITSLATGTLAVSTVFLKTIKENSTSTSYKYVFFISWLSLLLSILSGIIIYIQSFRYSKISHAMMRELTNYVVHDLGHNLNTDFRKRDNAVRNSAGHNIFH